MARLKDAILGNQAFGEKKQDATGIPDISQLDVGQNGYHTNFAGYASNAAYVRKNIIAVLVEAPSGFQNLPNPEKWVSTLKSLVELHPNSIEGLNNTLTVEHVEEAVGGAGEMQETVSNVTRERSVPVFNWTEKYGKPINAFFHTWITNLMMDPETKVPAIMARGGNDTLSGEAPTDVLPDFYSMTVLFFEPDPTHTKVVEAWLSTNMQPKSAGEVVGSRDLTAAGETSQYAIEFTALTQTGQGVRELAQTYLNEMNKPAINPNLEPAFVKDVRAANLGDAYAEQDVIASETGYTDSVASMSENATTSPPDGADV